MVNLHWKCHTSSILELYCRRSFGLIPEAHDASVVWDTVVSSEVARGLNFNPLSRKKVGLVLQNMDKIKMYLFIHLSIHVFIFDTLCFLRLTFPIVTHRL